jgi:hypothetical protein
MAKRTTKAPSVKEEYKKEIHAILAETFQQLEMDFDTDYEKYGFTKGTIVLHGEKTDLQIKLMTPKVGVDRYTVFEEETEAE